MGSGLLCVARWARAARWWVVTAAGAEGRLLVPAVIWHCVRPVWPHPCIRRRELQVAARAFWIGTAVLDSLFSYPDRSNPSRSSLPIQFAVRMFSGLPDVFRAHARGKWGARL